ncbi:hypothetical protein [Streptomyces sp. NPDC004135]
MTVGADGFEPDQIQLGDRPVPVRLHILDTMRAVEAALVQCADGIAAAAQRDPKHWRYTGRRTASRSVLWPLARIERAPGPYRRITGQEEQRIVTEPPRPADCFKAILITLLMSACINIALCAGIFGGVVGDLSLYHATVAGAGSFVAALMAGVPLMFFAIKTDG